MDLTHVRLLVDEYTACFRFYRDVLGFDPTFGDETSGYADFDTGAVTLALFDAGEMAAAIGTDPDQPRGRDAAMVVLGVEDVDATVADLDAAISDLGEAGAEAGVVAAPEDHPEWGIRTAHLRDPDGTLIEVNEPLA